MDDAQLINQTSGNYEYYTPIELIDAARKTMGSIDLDPASSHIANKHIKATSIFTIEDDGLSQIWFGKVWMNHPFGKSEEVCKPKCNKKRCLPAPAPGSRGSTSYLFSGPRPKNWRGHCITERIPGNDDWIKKLILAYEHGAVSEACCITYACTSEKWFQPLLPYLQCFLVPRTNYFLPDGSKKQGVTKGSVITYLGNNHNNFRESFASFGHIK